MFEGNAAKTLSSHSWSSDKCNFKKFKKVSEQKSFQLMLFTKKSFFFRLISPIRKPEIDTDAVQHVSLEFSSLLLSHCVLPFCKWIWYWLVNLIDTSVSNVVYQGPVMPLPTLQRFTILELDAFQVRLIIHVTVYARQKKLLSYVPWNYILLAWSTIPQYLISICCSSE